MLDSNIQNVPFWCVIYCLNIKNNVILFIWRITLKYLVLQIFYFKVTLHLPTIDKILENQVCVEMGICNKSNKDWLQRNRKPNKAKYYKTKN